MSLSIFAFVTTGRYAVWEEIYKRNPALRGRPIEYALDNTSISTYSDTIAEAQFGHAKRDPDLKQINYTVICDQCSGDIVFAHMYEWRCQ